MVALALLAMLAAHVLLAAEALQPAATCATTPSRFQQAIAQDAFRGGLEPAGKASMLYEHVASSTILVVASSCSDFLVIPTALAVA